VPNEPFAIKSFSLRLRPGYIGHLLNALIGTLSRRSSRRGSRMPGGCFGHLQLETRSRRSVCRGVACYLRPPAATPPQQWHSFRIPLSVEGPLAIRQRLGCGHARTAYATRELSPGFSIVAFLVALRSSQSERRRKLRSDRTYRQYAFSKMSLKIILHGRFWCVRIESHSSDMK
jgi:hypothetical protein